MICFLSNVSGCARIAPFPSSLITKSWHLGWARIATFSSTLAARNWNIAILALCKYFFYTQLVFAFHLQTDFYSFHDSTYAFCFFLLRKDFDTFHIHIDAYFFFRKILIPFVNLFLKILLVFFMICSWHFYIEGKKYLKNYLVMFCILKL